MKLIDTVAVIHDLEPSHRETRYVCLLTISNLLAERVVFTLRLSHFQVVLSLCLEPSLHRFDVVLLVVAHPFVTQRDLFGVGFHI